MYGPSGGSVYGSARSPAGGPVRGQDPDLGADRGSDQDPDLGSDQDPAKTGALSGTCMRPGQAPFTGSGEGDPDPR